jgi:ABC-type microcin C transport system permease subunit YejE
MFLLGADPIGRDELSRLLYGGKVSLQVAFLATALATLVGLFIGVIAGYFGGVTDTLTMRSVDVLISLPFLIVAIAIKRVIAKPDLWTLYFLLGLLSWTTLARVGARADHADPHSGVHYRHARVGPVACAYVDSSRDSQRSRDRRLSWRRPWWRR